LRPHTRKKDWMDSFAGSALENLPLQRANAATGNAPHRNWTAAHERALQAVHRGTKLTAILGPSSVSKTQLLEDLARRLEASGTDVWLLPSGEAVDGAADDGVVLIDEGCRLNGEAWARMFRGPGRYVIAGQPMLAEYLKTFPYGVETIFIDPIDADEVAPFFMARLPHFGQPAENVTRAAVDRLTKHAAGIPRMLSTLTRSAVRVVDGAQANSVRPRHIDAAATTATGISVAEPQPRLGRRERATSALLALGKHWPTVPAIVLICVGAIFGTVMVSLRFDSGGKDDPAIAAPATEKAATATSRMPADNGAQPSQPPAIASTAATSPRDRPPLPQSTEGQKSAASPVPIAAPTAFPAAAPLGAAGSLQGDDPSQRSAKRNLPGAHAVKHHHKPASTARPSDQSPRG
jgi:hypothetical protein